MWPSIVPVVPVTRDLVSIMQELTARASNCRSYVNEAVVVAFHRWVEDSVTQLSGSMFEPADVERLLRTRAYWESIDVSEYSPQIQKIIHHELDAVVRRLTKLTDELAAASSYWTEEACHYVLLDTNVYVEHETKFDETDWYPMVDNRRSLTIRIVVPQVVVDELDDLKRRRWNKDDATKPWRVNQTLQAFEEAIPTQPTVLPNCTSGSDGKVTLEVLPDPLLHQRLDIRDAEIIRRAVDLARITGSVVTVVSNDTGMIVRAQLAGLRGRRLAPLQPTPPDA